jgi:hypothetical protein
MKRFNPDKVRASSHLTASPLKSRAASKREYNKAYDAAMGIGLPKEREYLAPVKKNFVPTGFGRKRHPLQCKLSHEKRLVILEKAERRVAFFAELGVRV